MLKNFSEGVLVSWQVGRSWNIGDKRWPFAEVEVRHASQFEFSILHSRLSAVIICVTLHGKIVGHCILLGQICIHLRALMNILDAVCACMSRSCNFFAFNSFLLHNLVYDLIFQNKVITRIRRATFLKERSLHISLSQRSVGSRLEFLR